MKKWLLCLAFNMFSFSIYAQQSGCNCAVTLEKLVKKVETEYPGFADKTKEGLPYEELKQHLTREAKTADKPGCEKILKRYTDFFKDPHLWVGSNGSPFSSGNSGPAESISFDIRDFQDKIKLTKDPLEGVWSTEGYRIGIKKLSGNEYTGFIIGAESASWKAGDIKFRLFPDGSFEYSMLDRSKKKGRYTMHKEGILFLDAVGMALVRELPAPTTSAAQLEEKLKELAGFYFRKLSPRTSILKLPSFEYRYLEKIDELISQNRTQIEGSENLIIDLRGNPGGTTDAYQKLLPYISGKSIRNTGAEFLATQTYIGNLEAYKKSLDKNTPTDEIDKQIDQLKKNLGHFVNFSDAGKPVYIENVEPAAKSPRQVVILADKGTGSSAEYFLFIAKQSRKVKVLGVPSYGALDYGNAYLVDFGCPGYQVFMPTYRAMRLPDYPIDNIGIQPDIYLDSSVEDWVAFAWRYIEE
ncbi:MULTISPECIES: S41 family peptidase [unclassified Chitinophaga]|uniref:S41 family peptidase n=1 Tax=unclassified Chitinophaga TaxID=2619133 RepID=UPI00301053AE